MFTFSSAWLIKGQLFLKDKIIWESLDQLHH